ncbi:hypothetical protein C1646_741583 [Rhizophagus diaphanus]|nr:hypothetical protein C1646_741583 [Rhizophagus diaphanus] [Rhizophagus sp. MUCL 43196]
MVKPLREQPNLFRRIRILQLSTVIIISFLGLSYQYLIALFQVLIIKAKIFKFHCLILSMIFYLWIISGITNVYPLLKGIKWECVNEAFGSNVDFLMRVECNGYLFSTIFGWFMILEFFTSTMLYLRLWKTRNWWDNNITAVEDGESEKGINLGTDEETPSTESTEISPYEQHRLELDLGPRNSSNIKQIF